MLEAGVALNSTCIEETKAIFKTVEKEILEDESPNVAAFSNSFLRTNNTFNPTSSATLKRCPEKTGGTTDGKKVKLSLPIVSPSNSYSYSNGYGGNTTKVYFYIFGSAIVVAYLAKGSANGDLGWFLEPMKRIRLDFSQYHNGNHPHDSNSLVSSLQITDMIPLRDRESSIERPKKYPWKGNRSLFNHGYIHVAPPDAMVDNNYATGYIKNFMKVICDNFPNYRIEYGGSAAEETGELIQSMDDIFMYHDVARFCCKVFQNEIENKSFFEDNNISSYIRRHPNPTQLLLVNNGNNGMN